MSNVTVYVVTQWSNLPTKTSPLDATALNHIETGIKNVTDFINTLDAESGVVLCQVAFTNALKNKLDGIESGANNYTLPTASINVKGGVIVDGTTITIDQNGVISSSGGNLSTLLDVSLDDLEDGQILKWDDQNHLWVNSSEAEVRTQLSLLEDVDVTNVEDGQVLTYDENADMWVPGNSGGVLSYNDTINVLGLPPNPVYKYRITTPVMTSPNTPSGEVSASSSYVSYPAWDAFKQLENNPNGWISNTNDVVGAWIMYDFVDHAPIINKLDIQLRRSYEYVYAPKSFKLQGSNDGTTFTDLDTITGIENIEYKKYSFDITNSTGYRYYRLYIVEGWNQQFVGFGDIRLYERYLA